MVAKNTSFYPKETLNCRGRLVDISRPQVMGILNITPDSFHDGGNYTENQSALEQCKKMIAEGASMIDVGAMSSKPGSEIISADEEIERLNGILPELVKQNPEVIFSIDTLNSKTAKFAMDCGVHIINDISGATYDPTILNVAVEFQAPVILMHMQGRPENMQNDPNYNDVVIEVTEHFLRQAAIAKSKGIKDIILDPGFGFGKSLQHNYELLAGLSFFLELGHPILAGLSRKSMINKLLKISSKDALNGTTAANMLALQAGAQILRVHDVKEAVECVEIYFATRLAGKS